MLKVIVRSKRDLDAFKAMLKSYYPEWRMKLATLKGMRGRRALSKLLEIVEDNLFNIVIVGREDKELKELEGLLGPNTYIHVVSKARIRNVRPKHLALEFERARSAFRNTVYWLEKERAYIFARVRRGVKINIENNPAYDIYMGLGKDTMLLLKTVSCPSYPNPLIARKMGGVHDIYCGSIKTCALRIPDIGYPKTIERREGGEEVNLTRTIRSNKHVLDILEKIALNFMKKFRNQYSYFVVPWSGGKDSTTALLLAIKAYGLSRVKAIYVDTGVDFPHNRDYVKEIAKKLSVELIEVKARIIEELVEGKKLPTHENRWCTKLKIKALYEAFNTISSDKSDILVIVGDRDAESELRSKRPPFREHEGYYQIAPIKMWSGAHTQLYLLVNDIPLNPLYLMGFYRIGCYICPALRSWEVKIMKEHSELSKTLDSLMFYREFITDYYKKLITVGET